VFNDIDKFDLYLKKLIEENNDDEKNILTLLKNADNMTYKKIRDNLFIFFIAGHETTSTTLQYILYNLAKYPDIQEKLREEIIEVFPQEIDPEKIKGLTNIDNIINETMRIFTPVGFLSNRCNKEDRILGDYHIPKDSYVTINIYLMHKNAEVWGDDVEEFKPERWDSLTKEQRLSFKPFGGGPRICIGNTFSLFEQKIFICSLLKKFRFGLTEDSNLEITNNLFSPKAGCLKYNFEKI